jgi:hypothetical protein
MSAELRGHVYDFGGSCPKCKALETPMRAHCSGKKCSMTEPNAGEHLDCICLSCGYAWPARCADAKPMERQKTKRRKGGTTT